MINLIDVFINQINEKRRHVNEITDPRIMLMSSWNQSNCLLNPNLNMKGLYCYYLGKDFIIEDATVKSVAGPGGDMTGMCHPPLVFSSKIVSYPQKLLSNLCTLKKEWNGDSYPCQKSSAPVPMIENDRSLNIKNQLRSQIRLTT